MKKLLTLLFALSLVLTLVACEKDIPTTGAPSVPTTQPTQSTEPTTEPTTAPTEPTTVPTEPVHVHSPAGQWLMDKDLHWQLCTDCGESMNESAHTLDAGFCTQCDAEIFVSDYDGSTIVYVYDAQGNTAFSMEYDSEGTLLFTYNWEYTYDDAGNLLHAVEYIDGVISSETEFAPDADGNFYTAKTTTYYEDGSIDYQEYDQWFNNTLWISYNADGTVLFSLRYEYTCDAEGNVLYQKSYEDDVLTSESEYTFIESAFGAYSYCSKEITHYEDGSKLITEYDENYEILSEVFIDADGNPVDHSSKFDPELCAPLFGTWQGELLLDGSLLGMTEMEGLTLQLQVRFTFAPDGAMHAKMEMDPAYMTDFMVEFLYATYESEFGLSRDEVDAQFQQEMGMTVADYVSLMLSSGEMADQLQQQMDMVYYVQDGQIYAGNSWSAPMEPVPFSLEGDTLTLEMTMDDTAESMELVLTRAVDSSDKFDAQACAPLFSTWIGMITLESDETGLPGSIRYEVALTFCEDGQLRSSMIANIGDVKAATVEQLYQTFEQMGMTRAEADAAFLQDAGMTIDEYVDTMLSSGDIGFALTQDSTAVYYVADGQIYAGESWTDEMTPAAFTLDGDTLTVVIDDGTTLILTKALSDTGDSVINADAFTGDLANWDSDNGYLLQIVDGKLHYDVNFPGDYCAAMLNHSQQNGTYRFTLTVNALSTGYMDDWWGTELVIITRASRPGASWYDDLSQTGYTISSWGDLSEFCLGRCGYDDAFGTFQWNINDGLPHVIEITTTNNADNTAVEIIVTVDGVEVARAVDDGTKVKKERPTLYPDAGNLVIRAKWMEITIG